MISEMAKQYILDTDVCIEIMRGNAKVVDRFRKAGRRNCAISEISIAEFMFGDAKAQLRNMRAHDYSVIENYLDVISLKTVFAEFARNKAYLESVGKRIEDFDLLIGSTAKATDRVLVSGNIKHMSHIPDLEIEDWIRG